MSYDLYFRSKHALPTRAEFTAYFADRRCYTIEGGQALYQNDDTGVYFYFEQREPGDENRTGEASIAFNLHYFRPHFFGLEAAPEIDAFVRSFAFEISDPQFEGMGDGPFSIEGFLRGWNAGNRFACRAILSSSHRPDVCVYPTDGLERAWKWNYERSALQSRVGHTLFVPKLIFARKGGRAYTGFVWPDAVPICMPPSDLVFLLRDVLANRRSEDGSPEIAMVEWHRIAPTIAPFPQHDGDVPYFALVYDVPPDPIVEFVRSQAVLPAEREIRLANGSVLNEEIVVEALESLD